MSKKIFSYRLTKSGKKAVIWGAIGIIVLAVILFFTLFSVQKTDVLGSNRYTEQEIRDYVMEDPLVHNTILASLFRKKIQTTELPFVESFTIEKLDNHALRIHVNEKQMIGYIIQGEEKLYLNKDGIVLEMVPVEEGDSNAGTTVPESAGPKKKDGIEFHAAVQDVPQIIGLSKEPKTKGEKVQVWDEDVLYSLLGITRMVEKYQIRPNSVLIARNGDITLCYNDGKIQCFMGKDYLLEEKITRIAAILPKLEGETGILHLEDYNSDTSNIIFSKEDQKTLDAYVKLIEDQGNTAAEPTITPAPEYQEDPDKDPGKDQEKEQSPENGEDEEKETTPETENIPDGEEVPADEKEQETEGTTTEEEESDLLKDAERLQENSGENGVSSLADQ